MTESRPRPQSTTSRLPPRPTYGDRPLKRAIQRLLENPLALRVLEGDFEEGDTVRVDVENGELRFEKATAAEPATT